MKRINAYVRAVPPVKRGKSTEQIQEEAPISSGRLTNETAQLELEFADLTRGRQTAWSL